MSDVTHFDQHGNARMVDVSQKPRTFRTAIASGRVEMTDHALQLVRDGQAAKGDVLGVARLAGIMAAKRTSSLIPLCHPLPLTSADITFDVHSGPPSIEIRAKLTTTAETGVEMEALTAVSVAALTIYDMMKAVDRAMRITDTRLVFKDGGKSGRFENP